MSRIRINLPALRAFEAAARLQSLTRAARELSVTQAAVSHQVRQLEQQLGVALFRRLPRGLAPTDAALALLPAIQDSFERLETALARSGAGDAREVVTLGVVGTFAACWLLPRLPAFVQAHPLIDVRVATHNNTVDLAGEGLDFAVRYGQGNWPGLQARLLLEAPLAPLCSPALANRLARVEDLHEQTLLRSYFVDDWRQWFEACGAAPPPRLNGPLFDSSLAMVHCALQGLGVALAPPVMFARELALGCLEQPFATQLAAGGYWLTRLPLRPPGAAAQRVADWLQQQAACPTAVTPAGAVARPCAGSRRA